MEKEKSGVVGKIIIFILLVLFLVGGFVGGMFYEKNNTSTNKLDKKNTTSKNNDSKKELDINSRLIKYLYNEVTYDQERPSHNFGWEFNNYLSNSTAETTEDFYADKADELYKMILVGRNLLNRNIKYGLDIEVPEKSEIGYIKEDKAYYTKEYIELVYKQLFGSEATLDTTIPIHMDIYGTVTFSYDASTNNYYSYYRNGGGTTGPGGYTAKIAKAERDGKLIKIYQDVKLIDIDETTEKEKFQYIYTFELEDDGMYKFISRTKK